MLMNHRYIKKGVCVKLYGEIDHHACNVLRREIESLLSIPDVMNLHLDFSDVSFMDSSGVGMIIGRYKTVCARGGQVTSSGLRPDVARLYHAAGLHRIIPIQEDGGQDA